MTMNDVSYFLRKVRRECLFLLGLLFGSRDYARVVIVTRSRSGSNMLCSFLESHPQAFVWREVFRRPQYFTPGLTNRLINLRYLNRFRVVVFKVFYYHQVPEGFWQQLIADERTRIIHLIRTNYLDTYVSRRQAMESRRWESFGRDGAGTTEGPPVQVEIADMMDFLEANEGFINSFAGKTSGRKNLLTLTFDQMAGDEGRALIAAFLQDRLDPGAFGAARNARQGSSSLETRIANFGEVKRALLASKWRYLLDSPIEQRPG